MQTHFLYNACQGAHSEKSTRACFCYCIILQLRFKNLTPKMQDLRAWNELEPSSRETAGENNCWSSKDDHNGIQVKVFDLKTEIRGLIIQCHSLHAMNPRSGISFRRIVDFLISLTACTPIHALLDLDAE